MRTLSVPHIWLKLAKAKKKQVFGSQNQKFQRYLPLGSRTPGLHGHHPDLASFTPPASQL